MPTQIRPSRIRRERAPQKHETKLELVREQVDSGSLVIRQISDEERRRSDANRTDGP